MSYRAFIGLVVLGMALWIAAFMIGRAVQGHCAPVKTQAPAAMEQSVTPPVIKRDGGAQ